MSLVKDTGVKKPACGDPPRGNIRDSLGGIVDFQIIGTDPNVGVINGVNILSYYSPNIGDKNPDGTFLICIEAEGIFFITLEDGSDFIITQIQSQTYLGQWYPAKIYSVNVGTTGSFSVGY